MRVYRKKERFCLNCGSVMVGNEKKKYCKRECYPDTRKKVKLICVNCRKEFISSNKTKKYCCMGCAEQGSTLNRKEFYKIKRTYQCMLCGKQYVAKKKDRKSYCSRDCWYKGLQIYKEFYKEHYEAFYNEQLIKKKKVNTIKKQCRICNKEYETTNMQKNTCSKECEYKNCLNRLREKYKSNWEPYSIICKWCGKTHTVSYGEKRHVYCSDECQEEFIKHDADLRADKNLRKRIRQIKLKRQTVERFNPLEIFERDNWKCKICHKKVKKELKPPHPMSASLDHILPISKGGTHERKNVQLAHWLCNSKLRDKGQKQLRLIG